MKILLEFSRARPWSSLGLLLCLVVAGAAEGLGLSSVLPLVTVFLEGAVPDDPSGLEARLVAAFRSVGLEPTLGVLLLVVTATFCAKAVLVLFVRRQVGYAIAQVVTDLRLRLLRALLRADWRFYVHRPIGSFANAFVSEADRAGSAYMHATWVVFRVLEVAIYGAIAFATSWRAALAALVVAVVVVSALGTLVRAARRAGMKQTKLFRRLLSRLTDLLQGVKPLKAMGRAETMTPVLEQDTLRMQRARQRQVFAKEAMPAIQEPIVVAVVALGLFVGVVVAGIALPRVLLLAVLLERTYSAMNKAHRRYQKVVIDESAYWSLRRAIEEAEAHAERVGPGAAGPRSRLDVAVEVEAVTCRHGAHEVFRDASLSIPAGSVTALTGPSGAGKTTLVDLVAGLMTPDAGRILVDGVPLEETDLRAWRRSIGYVSQDTFLLNDTVARNVGLGAPEISELEIERALRAAHAWEFVSRLPDGMHTPVGERGSALSGGQRQRIAIARALVHRPALLILDEATTALDPRSEAAVLDAVRELRGETTVLAVSHQPALLEIADRVYRVADGGVVPTPDAAGTPRAAAAGARA